MVDDDDMTPEEKRLKQNFEKALQEYIAYTSGDSTMLLTSYIIEASGSGVTSEQVFYLENGPAVQRLGLLSFLETDLNESVFGG